MELLVPVTAKLLRKFYEAFGQEVTVELVDWANELDSTHRAELRDLAEQYFGRFEAKLEQRLAEEIGGLRNEMHASFAALRTDMAALRGDTIKWMFTFWAGSAVTTVATVWGVVSPLR